MIGERREIEAIEHGINMEMQRVSRHPQLSRTVRNFSPNRGEEQLMIRILEDVPDVTGELPDNDISRIRLPDEYVTSRGPQ